MEIATLKISPIKKNRRFLRGEYTRDGRIIATAFPTYKAINKIGLFTMLSVLLRMYKDSLDNYKPIRRGVG